MPEPLAKVELAVSTHDVGMKPSVRAGFTLIDILVSIAVVGVLIAIMLPSLASVKETAHQVVCRSNVRQIGFAFDLYAEANKGNIPSTITVPSLQDLSSESTWDTLTLRFPPGAWHVGGPYGNQLPTWDGLGILYSAEYLPVPKIFYCPSHKGANPFSRNVDNWRSDFQAIVGNFQYRGRGPTGSNFPNSRFSNKLYMIKPGAALVADGLRTQSDFNHQIGANMLRADLSVDWFQDGARSVVDSLPKDDNSVSPSAIQSAWSTFDAGELR